MVQLRQPSGDPDGGGHDPDALAPGELLPKQAELIHLFLANFRLDELAPVRIRPASASLPGRPRRSYCAPAATCRKRARPLAFSGRHLATPRLLRKGSC